MFDDAAAAGAVLVFDEAEALFGTRGEGGGAGRHDTANVGVLLQVSIVVNPKSRSE